MYFKTPDGPAEQKKERMVSVRGVKGLHAVASRSECGTLENHMHFIANSTTIASQTIPVNSVNTLQIRAKFHKHKS